MSEHSSPRSGPAGIELSEAAGSNTDTVPSYRLSDIQVLPFPPFTTLPDGSWLRRWHIDTCHVSRGALASIARRTFGSVGGVEACVSSGGEGRFVIAVRSQVHAGSDPVMLATRRFFRQCEQWDVGITAIEGQARAIWSAWLRAPLPIEPVVVRLVALASPEQSTALRDGCASLTAPDPRRRVVEQAMANARIAGPKPICAVYALVGECLRSPGRTAPDCEVIPLRPEVAADVHVVADETFEALAHDREWSAVRPLVGTLDERLTLLGAAACRAGGEQLAEAWCARAIHREDVAPEWLG